MDAILNRMRFGVLVAGLRRDLKLTHQELAVNSGLKLRIIQEIEQGKRVDLHRDDALTKLASGLRLTTLERQQFFFAASGISEQDFLRENSDLTPTHFKSEEAITELKQVIAKMRVPAFVTDSYCDVILANKLIIDFLGVPKNLLEEASDENVIDGRNMMRILFHPDANYRELVQNEWERHALLNIRFFRRTSLRYRGNKYFSDLKNALDQYDSFRLFWQRTVAEVNDEFLSYAVYQLRVDGKTFIEYFGTEIFLGVTPYGELYMNMYMPLNSDAVVLFDKMYKKIGSGCLQFSPFPDKRKWKSEKKKT